MIKIDIDMPTSCDVCDFYYKGEYGHDYCDFPMMGEIVDDYIASRHPLCPLIEVKEGD